MLVPFLARKFLHHLSHARTTRRQLQLQVQLSVERISVLSPSSHIRYSICKISKVAFSFDTRLGHETQSVRPIEIYGSSYRTSATQKDERPEGRCCGRQAQDDDQAICHCRRVCTIGESSHPLEISNIEGANGRGWTGENNFGFVVF